LPAHLPVIASQQRVLAAIDVGACCWRDMLPAALRNSGRGGVHCTSGSASIGCPCTSTLPTHIPVTLFRPRHLKDAGGWMSASLPHSSGHCVKPGANWQIWCHGAGPSFGCLLQVSPSMVSSTWVGCTECRQVILKESIALRTASSHALAIGSSLTRCFACSFCACIMRSPPALIAAMRRTFVMMISWRTWGRSWVLGFVPANVLAYDTSLV